MNHKLLNNILTVDEWDWVGVSKAMIRTRLQNQEFVRLDTATYARLDFMNSLSRTEKALAKIVAISKALDTPILSHQSAALWLGVPLIDLPTKVHISVPNNSGKHRKDISIHRNRSAVCAHATKHQGLLLTSPEQTALDCIAVLPLHDALVTTNYLLQKEKLTFDSLLKHLSNVVPRHQNRINTVLERVSLLCESPLETIIWSHIHHWNIEKPEQQVWFNLPAGDHARVDFFWRHHKVILEADGLIKYDGTFGSPETIIRQERSRQRQLEKLGWTVLRTDWDEAVRRPTELLVRLQRLGIK